MGKSIEKGSGITYPRIPEGGKIVQEILRGRMLNLQGRNLEMGKVTQ